jgi:AraC-like DNA-binding protein
MPETTRLSRQDENFNLAQGALGRQIARWTQNSQILDTPVPGLKLFRFDAPTDPVSVLQDASVCLIAQGAKRVFLGEEEYVYDAHHFLITSVGLPVMAQITQASPTVPYLGLKLLLDQRELARLLVDSNMPRPATRQADRGMAVGRLEEPLLCAFHRLLDLLDEPEGIPILGPLIQREILYRLLQSDQGPRLRQIVSAGSHGHQIARSLDWLRENFDKPLRVDDLASSAGMSTSTFHHHFRIMTAMSPLQFQKWMRLHEARRLMLMERQDATSAAFRVGYESPSQFSREYSRLFGAPPLRDIKRLHQGAEGPGERLES